jgi:hypothetical protein
MLALARAVEWNDARAVAVAAAAGAVRAAAAAAGKAICAATSRNDFELSDSHKRQQSKADRAQMVSATAHDYDGPLLLLWGRVRF